MRQAAERAGSIEWFWWSNSDQVFAASVRTCALAIRTGGDKRPSTVNRVSGLPAAPGTTIAPPGRPGDNHQWGWLIADAMGVPDLPTLRASGTLADRGLVTANFRDQYYGLVGHVSDDGDGPPLVTTGLIDIGVNNWGTRTTRFAKQTYRTPRVNSDGFPPFMHRWMNRCLVPKVLVATQTKVLEAVADPEGAWVPAVPVVRVVPTNPSELWMIAAVLTSAVASATIAAQSVGSGLSASSVRVSQRTLNLLPWPSGPLGDAVGALRAGDFSRCAQLVDAAYGVSDPTLTAWWHERSGAAVTDTVS